MSSLESNRRRGNDGGRDPLQAVWDALDAAGCQPRGTIWKATARCPAHDDASLSLSVAEGSDGRAVLHCHAGCEPADVVRALGLSWAGLFPVGHRNARPSRILAKPKPTINVVLEAIRETGSTYRVATSGSLSVADVCPACREGSLWVALVGKKVRLTCFHGCSQETILDRLARVMS
jgi:hypothetical protein